MYEAIYAQFAQDADLDTLLDSITNHLQSLPGDPYGKFYGDDWDERFGDD